MTVIRHISSETRSTQMMTAVVKWGETDKLETLWSLVFRLVIKVSSVYLYLPWS